MLAGAAFDRAYIDNKAAATADDESFDLPIAVGRSARLEVKRSGAIPYFCRVHPNMTGTVRVR